MCVCIMHTHVHTHTGVLRTGVPGDQTPHPRAAECTQMCHKANGQGLLQVAGQPNPCIPCAHAYTPGVLGTAFQGSSPLLMCCVCVCVCVGRGGWGGCWQCQNFGDGPLGGPAISVPAAAPEVPSPADVGGDTKKPSLVGGAAGGGEGKGAPSGEEAAWADFENLKEARQSGGFVGPCFVCRGWGWDGPFSLYVCES